MSSRLVRVGLIIIALTAIPVAWNPSLALSNDAGVSTSKSTNTNPHKHRYWRHRGGKHPHYGSRRISS
jgi:hypothetical protein